VGVCESGSAARGAHHHPLPPHLSAVVNSRFILRCSPL
jgi:hypothetical protein